MTGHKGLCVIVRSRRLGFELSTDAISSARGGDTTNEHDNGREGHEDPVTEAVSLTCTREGGREEQTRSPRQSLRGHSVDRSIRRYFVS